MGQADGDTIAKLSAHLAALAAHDPHLRALLDEDELRPGLILPQDIGGIVEGWHSMITRDTVGTAVFSKRDDAIAWLRRE